MHNIGSLEQTMPFVIIGKGVKNKNKQAQTLAAN
jgi:hypothetical protein